jgi:hypothetical protein
MHAKLEDARKDIWDHPELLLLFIQVYCPYATLGYERPTSHL